MTTPSSASKLFSLKGRIALVTGGSGGLGRHMACTLGQAGACVVLVARREDKLTEAASEIRKFGAEAAFVAANLADLAQIEKCYRSVCGFFGPPDILVNAAGMNPRLDTSDYTIETWNETLALNLSAPFFLARACVPDMTKKGCGNIINIASLQSFRAFTKGIAYGASKGGVVQLTRAMAEAWSRFGITANAIAPGFFPTDLTAPVFGDPDLAAHHARMTAVGRNGEPADLDGITIFLASRGSAYVTGQVIAVDGGYTAK